MKTSTIIILILFMMVHGVQSQTICDEDVVIQNQEDLDNFNCEIIDGDLTLILKEELNLEALSVLTEVRETLFIEFDPQLSPDLSGLRNLKQARELKITSHGGASWYAEIDISELQQLETLESLSVNELSLVGSFPVLKQLSQLSMYASYFQDITWLDRIDTIQTLVFNSQINASQNEEFVSKLPEGGELTIHVSDFFDLSGLKGTQYMKRLDLKGSYGRSLDGLSDLDTTDYFLITNTDLSEGCCGLSNYLAGDPQPLDFVFSNNSCTLEDILQGCSPVCMGDIVLNTQEDIDNFSCKTIEGNLTLSAIGVDTSPLLILDSIKGSLILNLWQQREFPGFQNLKYIGESFEFSGWWLDLGSFSSLSSVGRIDISWAKTIGQLVSLTDTIEYISIEGYGSPSEDEMYLSDPNWLPNVKSIDSLRLLDVQDSTLYSGLIPKLGKNSFLDFAEIGDPYLFLGLRGKTELGGLRLIGANLESFDDLEYLETVGLFHIQWVTVAGNCCGLSNLFKNGTISGDFIFENNSCTVEDILEGCSPVCSGDVVLNSQSDIYNLTCKTVEGSLTLSTMGAVVDTSPLLILDSIKGDLVIDVDQSDHSGFSNLAFVGNKLDISRGSSYNFDFSSFSSLNHVRHIEIDAVRLTGQLSALKGEVESIHLAAYSFQPTYTDWIPLVSSVDIISVFNSYNIGGEIIKHLSEDGHYIVNNEGRGDVRFNSLYGFKGKTRLGKMHLNAVNVTTFSGLESLMEIDELEIVGVESDDFSALCNLVTTGEITGNFVFESNSIELDELMNSCNSPCSGDYYVYTQDDADKFGCETLGGSLYLRSRGVLETAPFLQLDSIKGDLVLYAYRNYGQKEFPGFQNLKYIRKSLDITGVFIDLGSFSSLSSLGSIDFLYVKTMGQLLSLENPIEYISIEENLRPEGDEFYLSNPNWLPNVRSIDSLRLLTALDSTLYTGIIPKLNENSLLDVAENNDPYLFFGLRGREELGGLRMLDVDLKSFDDLEDLQTVGLFDIQRVTITENCCGLYNLLKNGSITGDFIFTNNSCTVEEILSSCAPEEVSSMSVYPNPSASGSVTVDWAQDPSHKTNIQVLDNFGKKVYEYWFDPGDGLGKVQLDISQYPSGVYLVRIITGDKVELNRLVKP